MAPVVVIDTRLFDRRVKHAFRRTVRDLEGLLPEAHRERIYAWPGGTRRESGAFAGSPRDVYDTGRLAQSQQPAEYPTPLSARITWGASHAAAVYLGAVFRKRQYSMPSRNVPQNALGEFNFPAQFAARLERSL